MTTLAELKKKRTLQREAEAADRAAKDKKAKEGSESSRKAKALLRQPRKLAMLLGGVVLVVGLLQVLFLGGFYLLSQSRLNAYYEAVEGGDFSSAADSLSGYLAHNSDDWQLQAEYAVLLLKLNRSEEGEKIFQSIQEQSPDSFSTDMQFYAALSNFKFKNTLIGGLEEVLESVPNFLPAQLGMGVIALDEDPAEALVIFSQAKERLDGNEYRQRHLPAQPEPGQFLRQYRLHDGAGHLQPRQRGSGRQEPARRRAAGNVQVQLRGAVRQRAVHLRP